MVICVIVVAGVGGMRIGSIYFIKNPFDPSLKTHKLKGEFSEFYSCSLTYEYRIICIFSIQNETIILVNIGMGYRRHFHTMQ